MEKSITANISLSPKLKWNSLRIRIEFKRNCIGPDKITFPLRNIVNLFIVYDKIDSHTIRALILFYCFIRLDCLCGAVKLTKNADTAKY